MTLDTVAGRQAYTEDHEAFRQTVRSFLAKEGQPFADQWNKDRLVPKSFWQQAGAVGAQFVSTTLPRTPRPASALASSSTFMTGRDHSAPRV